MISKSPDRHSFQKEGYLKRCQEKGEEPNSDYLDMFEKIIEDHGHKWDNLESRKCNLEYDLLTTDWILEKVRSNDVYAQNLYAAMCNNDFIKREMWPLLKEQKWSCSWRYAGGIIADMQQKGDYIDWYCSGIRNDPTEEEFKEFSSDQQEQWNTVFSKYVPEEVVTEEIEEDLFRLGWIVIKYNGEI